MNKIFTKFRCVSKTQFENGYGNVILNAVTGGSEENETFWKYTPSGEIKLTIDNKEAFEAFEVGKEYYTNFQEVEN